MEIIVILSVVVVLLSALVEWLSDQRVGAIVNPWLLENERWEESQTGDEEGYPQ